MRLMQELNDEDLMSLLKQGDQFAFDELYSRYWEILLKDAYRILKDKDACMDVLQEVFVWFWFHRETLVLDSVRAYLFTAIKYQIANYLRSAKVREAYVVRAELLQQEHTYQDDVLEVKELKRLIEFFTAELPARCQEIFRLSRQDYLSNKEIAQRLGIAEKTVEMQITIALKRLRSKISQHSAFHIFFF